MWFVWVKGSGNDTSGSTLHWSECEIVNIAYNAYLGGSLLDIILSITDVSLSVRLFLWVSVDPCFPYICVRLSFILAWLWIHVRVGPYRRLPGYFRLMKVCCDHRRSCGGAWLPWIRAKEPSSCALKANAPSTAGAAYVSMQQNNHSASPTLLSKNKC